MMYVQGQNMYQKKLLPLPPPKKGGGGPHTFIHFFDTLQWFQMKQLLRNFNYFGNWKNVVSFISGVY